MMHSYSVAWLSLAVITPLLSGLKHTRAVQQSLVSADSTLSSQWCDSVIASLPPDNHKLPVVGCSPIPGDSAALRQAVKAVASTIILYDSLTAAPYGGHRYVVKIDTSGGVGGHSPRDSQVIGSAMPDLAAWPDRRAITGKLLFHELFHQWTSYYYISGNDPDAAWLAEGFSDFMTAQAWKATYGAQAEEEFLLFYNTAWCFYALNPVAPEGWSTIPREDLKPWEDNTLDGGLTADAYYHGALVFWMLKQYLGEQRFWTAIHYYLTKHIHEGTGTNDFQRDVETSAGEKLDWFFKEWVHSPGFPQFGITAAYNAAAHRLTLHVAQTQKTSIFRMPVTIRVGTAGGDVIARAMLDSATQTVTVDNVSQPPTFVLFDDLDGIVKTLKFEQPTAWLIAQMQREAQPWQTWWAVDQLQQRAAHDTAATDALVTAALHAKYSLTRAQAALALGVVTASVAIPALKQTVHDTAVIVRRTALEALKQIGTPEALAVERSVFEQDQSDVVRTTAFRYVFTSPSTPAADLNVLFAQALKKKSYLNLLQSNAIKNMALSKQGCNASMAEALRASLDSPGVLAILRKIAAGQAKNLPEQCEAMAKSLLPQH